MLTSKCKCGASRREWSVRADEYHSDSMSALGHKRTKQHVRAMSALPRKRTKLPRSRGGRGTARQWVLALSGRQGNVWLQDEKQIGAPHREYRDDQCSDDDLMSRHSEYGQARPQHAGNKAYNRYDPNHRCDGHQCINAFFFPHAGSLGADPNARQLMPRYISV